MGGQEGGWGKAGAGGKPSQAEATIQTQAAVLCLQYLT